jgi:hypothetical protein
VKPLAIDLYCGLGGWAEGFLSEGYRVVGFDIEAHDYGTGGYPGELVLRDVRSINGADLIREYGIPAVMVGSSPCQEFSYRAMPWKRAKALPPPYLGIELFQAQFRIQREASEAAGRYIPMVVENVRGAQKWVGPSKAHWGSFYVWGDVPALMPVRITKTVGHTNKRDGHPHTKHLTNPAEFEGVKGFDGEASGRGNLGKNKLGRTSWSTSVKRRAASALIAKIPFPLAQHIARCFKPDHEQSPCFGPGPIPSGQSSEHECIAKKFPGGQLAEIPVSPSKATATSPLGKFGGARE